ncbi:MAG TPA: HDOD domain-containing protein [Tahibacter sp.]|nr:HDOD domain-containing protein [Tahibacter sp.]
MFVDDEQRVLDGIARMLFAFDCEWDVCFALGGPEALAAIEAEPVDIVVTDMRMPVMDGAQLLQRVQQIAPATLRMILSGHTEADAALRALNVAHQFLSKPCDPATLIAAVERMAALRRLLGDAQLRERVGRIGQLPPAPRVYAELNRLLCDPNGDAKAAAQILARDPALGAKVLHLANSAFFGAKRSISDVRTAVTRVGLSMLRTLVLASEVFAGTQNQAAIAALQSRAMLASLLAAKIAEGVPDCDGVETAALLADVGLLPCLADTAGGAGHAEVGAYLLGLWGLPIPIVEAVAFHHRPGEVDRQRLGMTGVVHIAAALAGDAEPDAEFVAQLVCRDKLHAWTKLAGTLSEGAHD